MNRQATASRPGFTASVVALLILAVLASPLAAAPAGAPASSPEKPLRMKPIQVKAGSLRGIVKGYTGKPYPKTTVELVDAKGKAVAKAVTNARGEFVLKDVPPGRYTAVIGGKARLPITMTKDATVTRLMVVPRYAAEPGAPPPAAGREEWMGLSTWTWVLIGAGVAAAIAIPIAASGGGGGGGGGPVSP